MSSNMIKYSFSMISCLVSVILSTVVHAQTYTLSSPNGKYKINVSIGRQIVYSVHYNGKTLLASSALALTLGSGFTLGENGSVKETERKTVDQLIHPVVKGKSEQIVEHYNALILHFKKDYTVDFRAYNEGIAYRFQTEMQDDIIVQSERVEFNFPEDFTIYFPEEERFHSHNERQYLYQSLSMISEKQMCSLPALVDTKSSVKILISESDLEDYPGLWLRGSGSTSLSGLFPAYPLETNQPNDRNVVVTKRADYLARTRGTRSFPWRFLAISENDGELVTNQLSYLLAKPVQLKDTSWIRPGKVAWDWFNYNNIYGVDFRAGINTETYKYYIDFASQYDIEYVILDEGWYKLGDLMDINPDIQMEEILSHAKEKNVGIILWVIWKTLDDQLQEALDQFEKWGVKGIKVDFMQRDDQWMVNYYYKIAREAAKRHLLVDFHGAYKPSGLRRAYPNVLTFEGVQGLEHNKWSKKSDPEHNVTIPFIRMVAGPMDYTPGAMHNAQKDDFEFIYHTPMSQGTRCHQLAMYVIFESPLQMLADSPTHYLREPECMEFLSQVPTVWDETAVLDAKVSDYIILARKNGDAWYMGAMTDWEAREFTVDFTAVRTFK